MCLSIVRMACLDLEASGLAHATSILSAKSMHVPVPCFTGYVQLFFSLGGLSTVLKSQQRLVYDPCSNLQDPRKISLASW